jgi:UDP-glucose-4-epimerase GalE
MRSESSSSEREVCLLFSSILVTGGAGFIGSHLTRELVRRGYSVVVLDNFHSGRTENLHDLINSAVIKFIRGDVRDRKIVREAIRDVDAVVHFAALIDVGESVKNPLETHDVNVTGTLNVLQEATEKGVDKFVFASSTAVYGDESPLPLVEEYALKPISPYAVSKVCGEFYCRVFCDCYDMDAVVLRYFNVYGPGQEGNPYAGVIAKFVQSGLRCEPLTIFGDGEQTRDFIHVDDVVRATVMALESEKQKGKVFNVCTGISTSVNQLAHIVREVLGNDVQIDMAGPRKGDVKNNYGDPSKAKKGLGFKAQVSLKKGIRQLAEPELGIA